MENKNKDYIINLRVSRKTYEKIKDRAKTNSQTISNLVRNIIDDSTEIITDLSDEILGKKRSDKFNDIISYHKGLLAQDRKCDNCGMRIPKQSTATIGETATNARYYFCKKCK
jgi:hypothetical protein